MNSVDELLDSLNDDTCPGAVSIVLAALWHDARGDWHSAHGIVQNDSSADGAWVHAYLHRKEGDLANARYWYRRAGQRMPDNTLQEEWRDIATTLMDR